MPRKIKINLDYLRPNSSFIYPLYSEEGKLILEARMPLTSQKIKNIVESYGNTVYYTDTGEKPVIPAYRMKTAYNKSKEIMDEIFKTDKLTRSTYREAEKVIETIVSDLTSTEIDTISLLKDLKSHDEYLYNHSVNVGILSTVFAIKLGAFSPEEIKFIALGSYLHDIGSTKIDRQLLNKEGRYEVSELQKMKRHPQLGYEILKGIDKISPVVLQSVLFHHEKLNQKGYYQLPYETLPHFPKIVSVCDIYDALTSKRPYRGPFSSSAALKALVNSIDIHFDYDLISAFINRVAPVLNHSQSFYSANEFCELNSKELAVITEIGMKDFLRPKVRVFFRFMRQGNKLRVSYYNSPFNIDLQDDQNRKITKMINNQEQINAIKKRLEERQFI